MFGVLCCLILSLSPNISCGIVQRSCCVLFLLLISKAGCSGSCNVVNANTANLPVHSHLATASPMLINRYLFPVLHVSLASNWCVHVFTSSPRKENRFHQVMLHYNVLLKKYQLFLFYSQSNLWMRTITDVSVGAIVHMRT